MTFHRTKYPLSDTTSLLMNEPKERNIDRSLALSKLCRSARHICLAVFIVALFCLYLRKYGQQRQPFCVEHADECSYTAPFIFDSVFSLLKQWHNTYAPNGHSVVVASIPANTQLFHAQRNNAPPPRRAFFALDAEMSIGIYASVGTTHLLTMRTTRALDLLYLDGQSASLTNTGSLDSQTALLRGSVPLHPGDEYIFDEDKRAKDLCEFIDGLGIDGIVRMNAGFEVLLCRWDSAGVKLAFSSNITVPGNEGRENNPDLPRDPNRIPPRGYGNIFAEQNSWEWIRSGVWHYGSPAGGEGSRLERRVKVDYCGIVTFYHPELLSLKGGHQSGIRGNQTYQNGWGLRQGHRLLGISTDDANSVRSWVHQVTSHRSSAAPADVKTCSGTDWQLITEIIVDQHKMRALEISRWLDLGENGSITPEKTIQKIHELSHAIIYPYLQYPSSERREISSIRQETIQRCAFGLTDGVDHKILNRFEFIIMDSIRIVMEGLCTWEWDIFEWSERHTSNLLAYSISQNHMARSLKPEELQEEIKDQSMTAKSTLSWIGWDLWTGCGRTCSWDEFCYIPMWPVIYAPGRPQGGIYDSNFNESEMYNFWQPKCINRGDFDRGGGRARDPWHRLPDVPPDGLI